MAPSATDESNSSTRPTGSALYCGIQSSGRSTQINGNISISIFGNSSLESKNLVDFLRGIVPAPIKPADARDAFLESKGCRSPGTCEWIKANEHYMSWLESDFALLWISGGLGKGKTMLSIFIAEEIERNISGQLAIDQQPVLLQYFCDKKDQEEVSTEIVLRGLMGQLLEQRPELGIKYQNESLTDLSFTMLWRCFEKMLSDTLAAGVYCILDGLDECNEDSLEQLLKSLNGFIRRESQERSLHRFHCVILSRQRSNIMFGKLSCFKLINLDSDIDSDVVSNVSNDIQSFINESVEELARARGYEEKLKTYVKEVLIKRAGGTFLWVAMATKELQKYSPYEVQKELDNLPPDLEKLYIRMLDQIIPRRENTTKEIFRWVTMAIEPLTISELGDALGNNAQLNTGLDVETITKGQVSDCGPLLTIQGNKVEVSHESVKAYLLRDDRSKFHIKESTSHLQIAKKCFHYLKRGLRDGPVDWGCNQQRLKQFPLLKYAVFHWTDHAQHLSSSEEIFDISLHEFYAMNSQLRNSWLRSFWFARTTRDPPVGFSLFHIASYFGLLAPLEKLCKSITWESCLKELINKRDERGTTPLHVAAAVGNVDIVRLLLKHGAEPNTTDHYGESILLWARTYRNNEVAELLVKWGATDLS
ncbi:hypothetical protein F5884DRAFT_884973 [Xylogone sp. PMI_703]|nr:hypothetical protein F5884DRAFT_884973 [Xylogone sp. PMI_703]